MEFDTPIPTAFRENLSTKGLRYATDQLFIDLEALAQSKGKSTASYELKKVLLYLMLNQFQRKK
jgi:hypothetical protein